jgi:hypothetical protein
MLKPYVIQLASLNGEFLGYVLTYQAVDSPNLTSLYIRDESLKTQVLITTNFTTLYIRAESLEAPVLSTHNHQSDQPLHQGRVLQGTGTREHQTSLYIRDEVLIMTQVRMTTNLTNLYIGDELLKLQVYILGQNQEKKIIRHSSPSLELIDTGLYLTSIVAENQ